MRGSRVCVAGECSKELGAAVPCGRGGAMEVLVRALQSLTDGLLLRPNVTGGRRMALPRRSSNIRSSAAVE
jgi:hypothetical protein